MGWRLAAGLLLVALVVTCHGVSKEEELDLSLADSGVAPLDDEELLDATPKTETKDEDDDEDEDEDKPTGSVKSKLPLSLKPKQDTSALKSKAKERLVARLTASKAEADEDLANAKAEKAQADKKMADLKLKLTAIDKKRLEKKAAKEAARNEMRESRKNIWKQHLACRKARHELKAAHRSVAKEKVTAEEMEVDIQELASSKDVGDSNVDIGKSTKIRDGNKAKYNDMLSKHAAMKASLKKAEDARSVAKQNLKDMRRKRWDMRKEYRKLVGKYAALRYRHKRLKRRKRRVAIRFAGAKGQAKEATRYFKECEDKATAIAAQLANAKDPSKILKTEKLRESAAIGEARDEDGLGSNGQRLVAKDGDIEKEFMKFWEQTKLPQDSEEANRNPLVAADARAATKDDSIKSAEKVLEGQGASGNTNALSQKLAASAKQGATPPPPPAGKAVASLV